MQVPFLVSLLFMQRLCNKRKWHRTQKAHGHIISMLCAKVCVTNTNVKVAHANQNILNESNRLSDRSTRIGFEERGKGDVNSIRPDRFLSSWSEVEKKLKAKYWSSLQLENVCCGWLRKQESAYHVQIIVALLKQAFQLSVIIYNNNVENSG